MAFTKKATVATEGILGAAAVSIKDSVGKLTEGLSKLENLASHTDDLSLQIAAKEDELLELDVAFKNKVSQHSVEFGLKVKEDQKALVEQVLGSQHLMAVPKADLEALKQELKDYETTFDKKVAEKVAAATGAMSREFKHKEELLLSDHKASVAEDKGKINSLTNEVSVLNSQLKIAQQQLADERQAGIERAKAGSVGSINIGDSTGNKR